MNYNDSISEIISQIAEVAGYLWERGWAERNGGNISYNITDIVDESITALKPLGDSVTLPQQVKNLCTIIFWLQAPERECVTCIPNP